MNDHRPIVFLCVMQALKLTITTVIRPCLVQKRCLTGKAISWKDRSEAKWQCNDNGGYRCYDLLLAPCAQLLEPDASYQMLPEVIW